ncbi:hypothetical protein NQ314_011646 [Rhamnusium bicolor]|uniref:acetate--CoA ligase n=1 Tax=Rhamnusium bicolor TaxID=1586634 RepID=A0AAV8XHB3_9CUCU|nr:hypothetical protein NQ314_011646 [Rhamnusium bicolor]
MVSRGKFGFKYENMDTKKFLVCLEQIIGGKQKLDLLYQEHVQDLKILVQTQSLRQVFHLQDIMVVLTWLQVKILRKDGSIADINELGRIAIKLPLPPGALSTLYKANERFVKTYFTKYPGYYDTMDAGYMDKNGLLYVTARADDIINVAGHRLSTLALENIILSHPDISMACVISVPDEIKNEVPLCLFVMKEDAILNEFLISKELVTMIRENIGPVAAFRQAIAVRGLPLTRSGKICRKSIADLSRNKLKKISGTVVDPTIYNDIREALCKLGFCK